MDRFTLAQPILRVMTPEAAHRATIHGLRLGLGGPDNRPDDPVLKISRFGLDFTNPVGLAAGFDKNAEVVDAMLGLGFGFAEFGTVTPKAQPGNPKPRIFRLPDQQAVINRLGLSAGAYSSAVISALSCFSPSRRPTLPPARRSSPRWSII